MRPAEQTIQLPTRTAIVDASDSSDDATAKDALKFKWELTVNPVSASPKLHSTELKQNLNFSPGGLRASRGV